MKMPVRKNQPAQQDVHIDQALTNLSIAYVQRQDVYIARKVFPTLQTDKQSDKYYIFNKNDWFRDEAKKRADNTESAGSGFRLSTDSFFSDVWAFHKDIGFQARRNADAQVNLERASVEFVTQRLLLRQELQFVTDFFTTSVWGTDTTPGNLWDDYTNSDPIEDIESAKETILASTGFMPNTLVLGYQVFRRLKRHPDFRDQIKYTSAENVNAALLARILEVDNVLVAKAIKATNLEDETAAYAFTHGKHALLCYVNPTPGEMQPSAGYTFAWDAYGSGGIAIDSFDIRKTKTTRVEGEMAFDNKATGTDLGVFFNGAVS